MCSDYEGDSRLYNTTNQWQCYRQCLRSWGQKEFKCNPVFIDNTIHELDFTSNDLQNDCNITLQESFDELVDLKRAECLKVCPKDCEIIEFKANVIRIPLDYETDKQSTHYYKRLVWDSTQPMFVYKEESVMSFTDYLVYCGGLLGLWFGTSAKDVINLVINRNLWYRIFENIVLVRNRILA